MIKVENKSRKEIADIGRRIGEAFADEKPECYDAHKRANNKRFEIMTEWFYRAGTCIPHRKQERDILLIEKEGKTFDGSDSHMIKRLLCERTPKALIAMAQSGRTVCEDFQKRA